MPSDEWAATFPVNYEEETPKFFLRLCVFTLSNFLYKRNCLASSVFKRRQVEGRMFRILKEDAENGGSQFWAAFKSLTNEFSENEVESIIVLICSSSGPIESLIFNFTDESAISPKRKNTELLDFQEKVFEQLSHVAAVAAALPPISEHYFPLKFQFRYRHRHEVDTPNSEAGIPEGFERITADRTEHQLFGRGASQTIFDLKLDNGKRLEVICCSSLIKSFSEISDQVDEYEETMVSDEVDMNSTLNI